MKNIVVIGSSGHAHLVVEALAHDDKYRLLGFIDSLKTPGPTPFGLDILGGLEELPELMRRRDIQGGIVGIGDNWTRGKIVAQVNDIAPDFEWVSAVHPSAHIGRKVALGRGIVVMVGASINPISEIQDHCSIGTHASLGHDGIMEKFSSLHPGATIGGDVRIGAFSAVCLRATIIHGIRIGKETVIGAGSTVLSDIPDNVVAYGTPARIIRQREAADRYF